MVTGSRPWAGMSHAAIIHAVCVGHRTLHFPDNTPEALAMLGSACMAQEPVERPSFADILDVLAPLHTLLAANNINTQSYLAEQC
jgi:Protein tyrosine and serine/threonine kinase